MAKSIYKYKEIITYIHPCTHVCVALTLNILKLLEKYLISRYVPNPHSINKITQTNMVFQMLLYRVEDVTSITANTRQCL